MSRREKLLDFVMNNLYKLDEEDIKDIYELINDKLQQDKKIDIILSNNEEKQKTINNNVEDKFKSYPEKVTLSIDEYRQSTNVNKDRYLWKFESGLYMGHTLEYTAEKEKVHSKFKSSPLKSIHLTPKIKLTVREYEIIDFGYKKRYDWSKKGEFYQGILLY